MMRTTGAGKTPTLILGIGNTLLGDEGIGVHAVHYLRGQSMPPDVGIIDGGTLSFTLASIIAQADRLIVVDAAELDAVPGTVRTFVDEEMDRFLHCSRRRSVHEVGLEHLLAIAHLTGDLPAQRALVAIQPRVMDWSERLSPELEGALPVIAGTVRGVIEAWGNRCGGNSGA